MSYGLFPFCVQEDPAGDTLLFRRSTGRTIAAGLRFDLGPGEKDKAQRLTEAAEALQACGDVAWYNATHAHPTCSRDLRGAGGLAKAAPLHIRPGTLSVAWSIGMHDVETHLRMVPALLRWTRWDREDLWQQLRTLLQVESRPRARLP